MAHDTRIWFETLWIRGRGWIRTLARIVGLLALLWAGYNMLLAPALGTGVFAPYREFGIVMVDELSGFYIGDIFLMAIGALVAWLP